jgi:hypothetical protein
MASRLLEILQPLDIVGSHGETNLLRAPPSMGDPAIGKQGAKPVRLDRFINAPEKVVNQAIGAYSTADRALWAELASFPDSNKACFLGEGLNAEMEASLSDSRVCMARLERDLHVGHGICQGVYLVLRKGERLARHNLQYERWRD